MQRDDGRMSEALQGMDNLVTFRNMTSVVEFVGEPVDASMVKDEVFRESVIQGFIESLSPPYVETIFNDRVPSFQEEGFLLRDIFASINANKPIDMTLYFTVVDVSNDGDAPEATVMAREGDRSYLFLATIAQTKLQCAFRSMSEEPIHAARLCQPLIRIQVMMEIKPLQTSISCQGVMPACTS